MCALESVKAVVFDVGNVLAHFSMDAFGEFLREHGAEFSDAAETWTTALFKAIPIWQYERGEISTDEFFAAVQAICPNPLNMEMARRLWTEIFTPDHKLLALAQKLSGTYQIGILSNTSPLHWEYLLKSYGLQKFAHSLMPSFRLGLMKPEPEIYHRAEEILGVSGAEIVFFDDRPENVQGARDAGWQAVHYCCFRDVVEALKIGLPFT
jgi:glucose-1-phosphatase